MKPLQDLSDDEIDSLLLALFGQNPTKAQFAKPERIEDKSDADLRRIRSRNHPDKWPNVDLEAYKAATEEIGRRRNRGPKTSRR